MKKPQKRKRIIPRKQLREAIAKTLALSPEELNAATRAGIQRLKKAGHPALKDVKI